MIMHGQLFGEFMGTMVLILFGDGVVANVLLKKSKGEGCPTEKLHILLVLGN